jgi:hypothetical protein
MKRRLLITLAAAIALSAVVMAPANASALAPGGDGVRGRRTLRGKISWTGGTAVGSDTTGPITCP